MDDDPERLKIFQRNLIGTSQSLVTTSKDCIDKLEQEGPWDIIFLDHDLGGKVFVESGEDTGWEVAKWISDNPEHEPKRIIIHSFNSAGATNMKRLLPKAEYIPGVWNQIKIQ